MISKSIVSFINNFFPFFLSFLLLILIDLVAVLLSFKIIIMKSDKQMVATLHEFNLFILAISISSVIMTFIFLSLLKKLLLKKFPLKETMKIYKDILTILTLFCSIYLNILKVTIVESTSEIDSVTNNVTTWTITFGIVALSLNIVYLAIYQIKPFLEKVD